jgi:uncharacterized protein involved in outer membrane biogenesis
MSRAKVAGLVLAVFLLAMAAGIAWVVFVWDINSLKPRLTATLSNALEREVSIKGDLELNWAVPLVLRVNELAVANSPWAGDPHLATVQRISVTIDWLALLSGNFRLDRVEVHGAEVALQQNDAGRWNLPTPVSGDTAQTPDQAAQKPFNTFALSDSQLRLHTSGENYQVEIDSAHVMLGDSDQPSQADLNLQVQQIPVSVEASLSPTRALFKSDGALDLDAAVSAADNRLAAQGNLASLAAPWPLDLRLTLDAPDPAALASVVAVPADLPDGVQASGRLQQTSAAKPVRLSDLKVTSGPNDIGGRIELDFSGQPWQVTAALKSGNLDLRPYLTQSDSKAAPAEAPQGESNAQKNAQFFSDQPFNLSWLERLNADVTLAAQTIKLPRIALADLDAAMTLDSGRLDLAPVSATVGGGTIDAALHLAAASAPQIDATLTAKALDLERMLQELGLPDSMQGDLGLKVDLQGQGASPADLAASLDGQLSMVMQEGGMDSRYLQKAQLYGFELTDAFVQLFKAADKEPTEDIKINCLVCRFDVTDGVAESEALVFDTALVGVVGNGQVNLKTENLNIALQPVSDGGIGIPGLAKLKVGTPITDVFKLGGTLSNPSISLDKSEATISLAKSLGGMLLFGPVGLGAALLDTELGDDNPCVKALKQAGAAGEQ